MKEKAISSIFSLKGIVTAFVVVAVIILLFFWDIGVNSKFFVTKDFNKAFQYRLVGDCTSFSDYIIQDSEDWRERCEKERTNEKEGIRRYRIQQVSVKFFSDSAFLQVELVRNIDRKEYAYSANYQMKKDGLRWKIDQEMK
jgi:hypothetical protein